MTRYSFWLELADGFLFAMKQGKKLALVMDVPNEDTPMRPMVDAMKDLLDDEFTGLLDALRPEDFAVRPSESDSWILISCNAQYDRKSARNHWCPAFFKEQVPEDVWVSLTTLAQAASYKECLRAQRTLTGVAEQCKNLEAVSPFEQAELLSEKEYLESKITRQTCVESCLRFICVII